MAADLKDNATLKAACDAVLAHHRELPWYQNWLERLAEFLHKVQEADKEEFCSPAFQELLWESDVITTTGMGTVNVSEVTLSPLRYRQVAWLNQLRLGWDDLNHGWQRWVLGYQGAQQLQLLQRWFGRMDGQLLGLALVGEAGRPVQHFLEALTTPVFKVVGIVMKAAPIGAFGAMAFTIGKFGLGSLVNLAWLVGSFYITSLLFVVVILGFVARLCGFSVFKLCRYLKAELMLVLGTSSSESALPSLMEKMEKAGCSKSVVGLVVPTGYSFNLDGTNIYMTLAALFIAQATNTELTLGHQVALLLVAMLSSKGAAGVTGAGFITLAATLAVVPEVPVAGMALILGVDRFMSECRSLTNFIGNAVATVVVSRWENALDHERLDAALNGHPLPAPATAMAPVVPADVPAGAMARTVA